MSGRGNGARGRDASPDILVWIIDFDGTVVVRGVLELVVCDNGVILAGACFHRLGESQATLAVGIRAGVERRGEGVFAAVV